MSGGGPWCSSEKARTLGVPAPVREGSEEQFITEHYWGYTAQRDGGCIEYEVAHPRWRVWQTSASRLDCDVERMYGRQYVRALGATPTSAFMAEGSPVIVYRGVRLRGEGTASRGQ